RNCPPAGPPPAVRGPLPASVRLASCPPATHHVPSAAFPNHSLFSGPSSLLRNQIMTENLGVLGKKSPRRTGVERVVNAPLPTVYGKFEAVGYMDHDRGDEQVALVHGDIGTDRVLVRLHSE